MHVHSPVSTQDVISSLYIYRDFFFRSVVLTSRRGRIEVDETLLASGADLKCQSGADSTGTCISLKTVARETNSVLLCTTVCESCCQANGECVDGECQCRAEFEGNDCGEFL